MSLPLNLDMLITYPSIVSQAPVTHTAIEAPALPPEINQLQELLKITGNNLPLAIAILIALVFYKDKKKRDQESQDHAIACDIERKDLLKRLDAIESEFKQFERDQVKIMVGDGDMKDRIDRLEVITEKLLLTMGNMMVAMQSDQTARPIALSDNTPKLLPRDELRRIVNKAANESCDYPGTWKTLYTEIYYRLHVNAQERAKHANVSALDILEAEGLLENAVLIAKEIF